MAERRRPMTPAEFEASQGPDLDGVAESVGYVTEWERAICLECSLPDCVGPDKPACPIAKQGRPDSEGYREGGHGQIVPPAGFMTGPQVLAAVGCSQSFLNLAIHQKRVPAQRGIQGTWLVAVDDLEIVRQEYAGARKRRRRG